jgi:hypothetical protein
VPFLRTYGPLLAHRAALSVAQTAVTFPLAEIEELCGPLSASARTSTNHWRMVVNGVHWRRSGWRARLHVRAQRVTFTRRPPDAPP